MKIEYSRIQTPPWTTLTEHSRYSVYFGTDETLFEKRMRIWNVRAIMIFMIFWKHNGLMDIHQCLSHSQSCYMFVSSLIDKNELATEKTRVENMLPLHIPTMNLQWVRNENQQVTNTNNNLTNTNGTLSMQCLHETLVEKRITRWNMITIMDGCNIYSW